MRIARFALLALSILSVRAFALDNASFEWLGGAYPWRALGDLQAGKGQMKVVPNAHHEGKQSLLVTGQEGSDAMVAQEVTLPANSLWRARCWIKTQGLESAKSAESAGGEGDTDAAEATVQVRTMDDKVVAEAQGVSGTGDWQQVDVAFRVPAGARFLLALVVTNPGKAGGQAWFDDVRLDRLEDAKVEQHVLNFPILWLRNAPYNKLLPKDANGNPGGWWCHQMAAAQIVRYWSMKTKLRCSGTYWYLRNDTKECLRIDYNTPLQWARMAPSLTRLPYTDPRVEPVAEFVFRFLVAQRSQWPAAANGHYYWTRNVIEAFIKYFGFDSASVRYIHFGEYLKNHSWSDLHDIIRKEIDEGRPVYVTLSGTKSGHHSIVLTGYRKIADQYEFTFHWGRHGSYHPSQTFRLDKPIRDFDTPNNHSMLVGLRPDTLHEQLPLYNKLAEQWDSDYDAWAISALSWNGDRKEYATVYPAGPKTAQKLYYQRISQDGLAAGKSFALDLTGNCRKPVMAWSGSAYGLAWEDRSEPASTIWFARLLPEDGQLKDWRPIRIGQSGADTYRPSVTMAYDGSDFGLVWMEGAKLQFAKIPSGGARQPPSKKMIADGVDPYLVWLGDGYVLLYGSGNGMCLARLDRDGNVQGKPQKINPVPGRVVYTPRLVWSGSQFGIVWEQITSSRQHEVWFCRADAQGKLIAGSAVQLSDVHASGPYIFNPWISCRQDEFVVTYRENDAYLARLDGKGTILEKRYLFCAPDYVMHVTGGAMANVLYLHGYGPERSVEIESCLFPLARPEAAGGP